jgi:hypothetical protein
MIQIQGFHCSDDQSSRNLMCLFTNSSKVEESKPRLVDTSSAIQQGLSSPGT